MDTASKIEDARNIRKNNNDKKRADKL